MGVVARDIHFRQGELNALLSDLRPPTADDVPVTSDGLRLDTKEAFLAWLDALNRERAGRFDAEPN
ncbi:hypothetical protein BH18ACT4_BH18ACT4_04390 [soil metagenome]